MKDTLKKRIKMYRPLMILVATMLIFYAVVPAVSAGSQTWYFTEDENTTVGAPYANDGWHHHKDLVMNKTKPANGTYSNLYGQRALWFYANTGAQTDLGFGEHAWTAKIYTSKPGDEKAGNTITVDICKITPDGTVTVIASGSEILQSGKNEYNISCADNTDTTQDFSTGDWLGARVSWNGPANDQIRIYYDPNYFGKDKDSYITSPSSDPGCPTSPTIEPIPEFTTIAIPTAIVLGLMFLFRPRKRKS